MKPADLPPPACMAPGCRRFALVGELLCALHRHRQLRYARLLAQSESAS
ncbi:MAG: hypothetical protein RL238_2148 [Actinomycetota bacterium]|jgi:hypothetical protein